MLHTSYKFDTSHQIDNHKGIPIVNEIARRLVDLVEWISPHLYLLLTDGSFVNRVASRRHSCMLKMKAYIMYAPLSTIAAWRELHLVRNFNTSCAVSCFLWILFWLSLRCCRDCASPANHEQCWLAPRNLETSSKCWPACSYFTRGMCR